MQGARMQISPEQGAFMALLAELMGVRRALEVGVFTGYSSVAVASALPPDGLLVACDRDERSMEVARRYWKEAGVEGKVRFFLFVFVFACACLCVRVIGVVCGWMGSLSRGREGARPTTPHQRLPTRKYETNDNKQVDARLGPAEDTLRSLLADPSHGPGSFDFAFVDADKRSYQTYFELCLRLVRKGGLVAVDNVLWYGRVADEAVQDKATAALRDFNAALLADERVTASIVPVGDGMALCRVR